MKAMILAAGLGTRLGAITQAKPKPLVEAGGITMLEHMIGKLKAAGVRSIVINLFHLGEQIEEFVRQKSSFGLEINFTREQTLLGTGGGLKNAAHFFDSSDNFFLCNADVYTSLDFSDLYRFHVKKAALATLAVMERPTSRHLLFDENDRLTGWRNADGSSEIANAAAESRPLAFSGLQVLRGDIFKYMDQDHGEFSIIRTYIRSAGAGEKILAFRMGRAFWIDVGTPEKLEALRRYLAEAR
jgi:NDP-sugar pyrophosphorylase family protein